MCRLLAMISSKPASLYFHLVEAECSLLKQAKAGKQSDGWGIGYYLNGKPFIVKSPGAAYEEEDLFKNAAREIKSNIIIAHVRKASNPRGLPREKLIGMENTQPFNYSLYLFAHNGTVRALKVFDRLESYKSIVKGVNDSEIYFALLIKEWEETGDPIEALKAVEEELWKVAEGPKNPFSSLNAVFSDGERIYAVNRYVEGHGRKSLCYGDSEIFRMCYMYTGDRLVVSSERTCDGPWSPLSDGHVLVAEACGDRVEYRITRLK